MSEQAKGWMGWMAYTTDENAPIRVRSSKTVSYKHPVYIIPLDPGGPLPGEVWEHKDYGEVEIAAPVPNEPEWMTVSRYGGFYSVRVSSLSRPPTTKTVTVELTEDEAAEVIKLDGWAPHSAVVGGAIRKFAAALEELE